MPDASKPRPVALIGAPTDIGAGHRGASMGPEALRVAGLAEALRERGLDVIDTRQPRRPAQSLAAADRRLPPPRRSRRTGTGW